ncbi:alcohol dehydrogenase catalytic domain-containing protein [Telmatospirillum sp.]|uniref:zinc-dependent alcohol dehydrogenase n=1 Tax=Telmatospirillum sp. TaxID=2079197 RepID=UPI00284F4F00|nr:alcohol dehydrogenase catalytic domain-containing protein [Telmatospirillum sp.]MDR3441013.1 alcohol dehydrogenase catalytic domain-containing protein [Telmatospirillum sp.]
MTVVSQIKFTAIGAVTSEKVEVPTSALADHDVRIAPAYLGICGSDLHVLGGGHPFAKPPVVPGHEISAVVTGIGAGVTTVSIGDHVVVDPIMACMKCRACRSGRFNLCEPPMVAGFRAPGFGRSSHVVPERNIHIAPKSLPLDVLAFAEPAACACHCVNRMPAEAREDVLVIGAGTIGLSIVQALRILGAGKITVVEPDERKRALALKLGAARVCAPGQLADDERFTGVIDVVAAQATLTEACTKVVAGGTVVCMGVPNGPREIPLPSMQRFERNLVNSGMYVPGDFDAVIGWLKDGLFDTSDLITDIFPVDAASAAYARAKDPTSIKVLLKFSE